MVINTIILFLIILNIIYFLWFIILSFHALKNHIFLRNNNSIKKFSIDSSHIAILLTVCDDFDENVANSLLTQVGCSFELFILDDSRSDNHSKRINNWIKDKKNVKVVRRANRIGFKAGNINNWLNNFECGIYEYVLIADADVVLPRNYLRNLLDDIKDTEFVFVQGCHVQKKFYNWFEKTVGPLIDCAWLGFILARNSWGLPHILGHGVLIKTYELIKVGGFPTIVSEDLALTIQFSEKQQFGILSANAVAYESAPSSIVKYRKRLGRWIAADTEVLRYYLKRILNSKIGLTKKLDVLLRESYLPILGVHVCVLIVLALKILLFGVSSLYFSNHLNFFSIFIFVTYLPLFWLKLNLRQKLSFFIAMPYLSTGLLSEYPAALKNGITGRINFDPTNSDIVTNNNKKIYKNFFYAIQSIVFLSAGILHSLPILIALGFASLTTTFFLNEKSGEIKIYLFSIIFWFFFLIQFLPPIVSNGMPIEVLYIMSVLIISSN